MKASPPARMARRTAVKWMLTAAAGTLFWRRQAAGAGDAGSAAGYGLDPNLLKAYQPGELWPLTFDNEQHRTAAALCATIIPADGGSPDAATLGVQDFIDEWISAPYPAHQESRTVILDGLQWLDAESYRRFSDGFADLTEEQRESICAPLVDVPQAAPDLKTAAQFFHRFRDLTLGGFYTTPEGMADVGYVGNRPSASFAGPPAEVLAKLGLTP